MLARLTWLGLAGYNLWVFGLYALDKWKARLGRRRIPEARLLRLAAFFGGAGALLAMWLFRHKIRKPRFAWGVPLLTAAQGAVLYGLWRLGAGW